MLVKVTESCIDNYFAIVRSEICACRTSRDLLSTKPLTTKMDIELAASVDDVKAEESFWRCHFGGLVYIVNMIVDKISKVTPPKTPFCFAASDIKKSRNAGKTQKKRGAKVNMF